MPKTLVISDLHLGVQRTGGTTLTSAAALREWGHEQHRKLLQLAPDNGCDLVVVNGDLSDVYDLPLGQALEIYIVADEFLTANKNRALVWALGNHDLSKDSSRLGTVAFVGALLASKHDNFRLLKGPAHLGSRMHVIPHVANQDLFELELSRVPEGTQWLLLHCNYDNTFAMAADHSLNLSRDQAKELKAKGFKMVLGHEHQGAEMLGGSVIIVGNQYPTSVADCLAHSDRQKGGKKHALIIDQDLHSYVDTWTTEDADGWFAEVDWRELKDVEEEGRGFVRVNGDALAAESADAIKAIAAFRQRSNSFVVTNAVKVEQLEGMDDIASSIEDIRSVNVIDLLMEQLDVPQRAAVEKLLEMTE